MKKISFRAVYDRRKKTRNLISSITSMLPFLIAFLFGLGVINLSPEGEEQFQLFAMNGWEAILALIEAVKGMWMLFRMEDKSKIRPKYLNEYMRELKAD